MSAIRSVVLAVGLTIPGSALGQSAVPEVRLTTPDRTLPHQFTQIRGIRELADGRLIVTDRLEPAIYALDWNGNRLTRIGREGEGPREYRLPTTLIPFPGDSTLVIDEGNLRLVIIGPDLAIHRGFTNQRPGLIYGIYPRAVDPRGRYYFQVPSWASGPPGGPPVDSIVVARIDWRTGAMDTLTLVKPSADPGPVKRGLPYVPFSPQDVWTAAPDGRVIVARVGDYHLELRGPDGRITRGAPVAFTSLPVTQADKISHSRTFLENSSISGRGGANTSPNALSALPPEMLTKEAVERMVANNAFAERKPPFTEFTPKLGPDGSIWIERSMPHGVTKTFDVFSPSGALVRRVSLPQGRRLVLVGAAGIYLVRPSEEGLETLERYPRP